MEGEAARTIRRHNPVTGRATTSDNGHNENYSRPIGARVDDAFGLSKYCTLGIHGDDFSKSDVLLNWSLFSAWQISENVVLKIALAQEGLPWQPSSNRSPIFDEDDHDTSFSPPEGDQIERATYVTTLPKATPDLLARHPNLEISLLKSVAEAIGFTNRSRVIVSLVRRVDYGATHVELVFRDRFLTRADMWQFAITQLASKNIYRGQKITFMDIIKVQIKTIFRNGRKISSGFFNRDTRPVWRSESSRFMIFIQMSKEMWDFDSEGTGEVMFQRVVAGFLPELFSRWKAINARHIVSIILFTRMSCESVGGPKIAEQLHSTDVDSGTRLPWRDYYRILVSDLAFDAFSANLYELKREFKQFLRDVTLDLSKNHGTAVSVGPIRAEPTTAVIGNVLEAINIASSTFAADYIDRSLVHSGLSIILVSPGTGIFEVNHRKLQLTTEKLIEYGISIDLVCLSQPPLHSVPLFKHKKPKSSGLDEQDLSEWSYSIPHWLDVSFWSPKVFPNELVTNRSLSHVNNGVSFVPRVRMYEVQMMGIMDDLNSNIAIPAFHMDQSKILWKQGARTNVVDEESQDHDDMSQSFSVGSSPILSFQRGIATKNYPSVPSSALSANFKAYDADVFTGTTRFQESIMNLKSPTELSQIVSPPKAGQISETTQIAHEVLSKANLESESQPQQQPRKDRTRNQNSGVLNTSSQTMPILTRSRGLVPQKSVPLTQLFTNPIDITPGNSNNQTVTAHTKDTIDSRPSTAVKASETSLTLRRLHDLLPSFSTAIMRPLTPSTQVATPIDIKSRPTVSTPYNPVQEASAISPQVDSVRLEGQTAVLSRISSLLLAEPQPLTSPWLTVLNPCDPKQLPADATRRLGRWQHVSPGPFTKTAMRWRSLCCPAAVPLTTEVFPSKQELQSDYSSISYVVDSTTTNIRPRESPVQVLMRKLIGVRLRHNFQVVVGKHVSQALDIPQRADFSVYDPEYLCQNGTTIALIRGSQVHVIHFLQTDQCHVTIYKRHKTSLESQIIQDQGSMKTMLSRGYVSRELLFSGYDFVHDWQAIDVFITGQKLKKSGVFPDRVPFWRTRLVVIPQSATESAARREPTEEDTAEEVRLEGIRRLSIVWQNHSVAQILDDGLNNSVASLRKATNPLDIIYSTTHPSHAITNEPRLSMRLLDKRNEPVIPDSQKLIASSLDLANIASMLQGARGIAIETRRWHWRIHRDCFVGADFVTWITQNFKDFPTRDDALKYGNKLMDEGLFVHVNERRRLRDGNYFYQIQSKYRLTGPDTKGSWFGRIAASIPSTPFAESTSRTLGAAPGSRSSSMSHTSTDHDPLEITAAVQQPVVLSETMIYGLDPLRKSYQDEYAVLHYDRIASVEDCYHLRVDWLNATPSLIEDAIESWSQLAEKHNLRLVEVPIVEASKIHTIHPFRGPHLIKLSKLPPINQFRKEIASLSTGNPLYDPFHYHKMILQKFDFVLDLETMGDFPQSREVSYSWGKLDYELPQYISREGVLTAQITREGELLLVANRLYTNRSVAMRGGTRHGNGRERGADTLFRPSVQASISQAVRGKSLTNVSSPVSSPIIQAISSGADSYESANGRRMVVARPEDITYEIERFCNDERALEEFYQEETRKLQKLTPVIMAVDNSNLGRLGTPPTLSLDDGPSLRTLYNTRKARNPDSSPVKTRGIG